MSISIFEILRQGKPVLGSLSILAGFYSAYCWLESAKLKPEFPWEKNPELETASELKQVGMAVMAFTVFSARSGKLNMKAANAAAVSVFFAATTTLLDLLLG